MLDDELPTPVAHRHRDAGLKFSTTLRGRGGTQSFGGEPTRIAYRVAQHAAAS